MFVLTLPLTAGSDLITLVAFVGGLSAATAMVIVESVALSIMVSNDIVIPWVLKRKESLFAGRENMGAMLLMVRRVAIFVILFLAYVYYRMAGEAQLASIGLSVFRRHRATGAGLFRRADLAPRHCARRRCGPEHRHADLGLYASAAELCRSRHHRAAAADGRTRRLAPAAAAGLARRRLPPLLHGVLWSLSLNVLAYVAFSFTRAPASVERLQANLFVPSQIQPVAPTLRRWRSPVRVDELTKAVARYLGEERTRAAFKSFAGSRRIDLAPDAEADFQLLRYAEHLLASAIGAASSRLVLTILLRKRALSTSRALKLLDDASAAIHYNREILQTALDHVRQGIAVFDKELGLTCWNRYFGEILNLPADMTQAGVALEEILRVKRRAAGRRTEPVRARAGAARTLPALSVRRALPRALRRARPGRSRCAATGCRMAAWSSPSAT